MSYDVSLTTPDELGREHELFEVGNYTGNVSRMWTEALGHPLSKMHGRVAKLEVDALEEAICRMRIEPDLYRAMNPPNGWGNYEGALAYLERLLDGCRRWPDAMISVDC